jgi:CBS domain-containing protein
METKRVEEIMIPLSGYPHVLETQTLKEAMLEMLKCQIEVGDLKSLPRVVLVLNRQEQLAGVLRRRDIMRGLEPEFLVSKPLTHRKALFDVKLDANLPEMFYDRLVAGIQERSKRRVSEVMMPVTVTIGHDEHVIKAIYEMVDKNLSLLPVLSSGRVVGVIRSVEVFRELSRLVLGPEGLAQDCG